MNTDRIEDHTDQATRRAQLLNVMQSAVTNVRKSTMKTEELVAERHKQHGLWADQAYLSNEIKANLHEGKNWLKLMPSQREALDMIAVKVARILTGDPNHLDHWDDIAGYAHLGGHGHTPKEA